MANPNPAMFRVFFLRQELQILKNKHVHHAGCLGDETKYQQKYIIAYLAVINSSWPVPTDTVFHATRCQDFQFFVHRTISRLWRSGVSITAAIHRVRGLVQTLVRYGIRGVWGGYSLDQSRNTSQEIDWSNGRMRETKRPSARSIANTLFYSPEKTSLSILQGT